MLKGFAVASAAEIVALSVAARGGEPWADG
jgi:hypothetical protein